jgi:Kinetochore Sim4 complex subunit FTA2
MTGLRPKEDLLLPLKKRPPFRALVKDLVESAPEVTEELIKAMLRELKSLHRMRIFVMDVAWRNYIGGHLVDFGSAWTQPCFDLRRYIRSEKEIERCKTQDLADFDEMVEGLDIQTETRAIQITKARYDLRPRKRKRM